MADTLLRSDSPAVRALRPSPNFGARKNGKSVDCLILHYTGMPAGRGMSAGERAIRWLENPVSQVSAHYVVDEDGLITQMVAEEMRAWHAGLSCWQGEADINSVSIGIEIANAGHVWDLGAIPDRDPAAPVETHPGYHGFADIQIDAVIALASDITRRHGIPAARVLAHSDIAPARKQDPGEKFPWARLAEHGLGLWVPPEPIGDDVGFGPGDRAESIRHLQQVLSGLGYVIEGHGLFDEITRQAITAFQRHWRQDRVDGRADLSTIRTAERLARKVREQAGKGKPSH
jgi:N-acetylmuramoyl-L-alanine amidase